MSDPTALLVIGLLFGSLMLILYLFRTANIEDNQKQAQSASEKFAAECPICGHDQVSWGLLPANPTFYLNFAPQGKTDKRTQVVVFRCENCGHLMLFANPSHVIKRKSSTTEQKAS